MDQSKTCARCGERLPLSAFYRNRTKPDGRQSRCRACTIRDSGRSPVLTRKAPTPKAYRDDAGKTCPRCGRYQEWACYARNARASDGCQSYCRTCSAEVAREYELRNADVLALRRAERLARPADPKSTKQCRKCGEIKACLEFYLHRSTRDGRANYCRSCAQEYQRSYQAERREQYREYSRKRQLDPKKRARDRQNKRGMWLRLYGLTHDEHDALLARQNNACAICGEPGENWAERGLHVDHDHESGLVRGLLCGRCNLGLGYFKDSPDRLAAAVEYLKNPPAQIG